MVQLKWLRKINVYLLVHFQTSKHFKKAERTSSERNVADFGTRSGYIQRRCRPRRGHSAQHKTSEEMKAASNPTVGAVEVSTASEGKADEPAISQLLLLHCLPAFSLTSSMIFINVVSIPFYASLGVQVEYLLLAVALSRAVDAVTDPFIAHWFETVRTEYLNDHGIRNQACLVGGIVSALLIGLHLSPPITLQTNASILTWFSITYIFFTIAFSCVAIPLTAQLWKSFPYNGSIDEYRRTGTAFVTDLMFLGGLALVFLLSGYAPASERYAKGKTPADYDSCYSSSGIGTSCMAHPNDGHYNQYTIFNASAWDAAVLSGTSTNTCQLASDGSILTDPSTLFTPSNCIVSSVSANMTSCLAEYCACVGECTNLNNLVMRRVFVGAAGWMLCSVLIVALSALLYHLYGWQALIFPVKSRRRATSFEGSDTAITTTTSSLPLEPLVPKLVNLLRNKVVRSFLIPYALDSIMLMTVLGTIGYFIRSVIKPENADNCNSAVSIFGTESDKWSCQSPAVASLLLTLICLSSGLFACGWFYVSRVVGTVRAWQVGSLVCLLTILALLFSAQRHDAFTALGLGLLFGVGSGSMFFSESVVIDVIHYYEFISGYQYQHMFAMFKFFFLKVSVLLMHILPLALFYEVGFNPAPPAYVKASLSHGSESSLGQLFTVAVPTLLCAASFYFKMHFRLVDKEQLDLTVEGIRTLYGPPAAASTKGSTKPSITAPNAPADGSPVTTRKRGVSFGPKVSTTPPNSSDSLPATLSSTSAADPTSGIMYPAERMNHQDRLAAQLFSHFFDTQCIIDYHSCARSQSPQIGVHLLISRMRDLVAVCAFVVVALVVGIAVSADVLGNKSGLFIVPLLLMVAMGYALFACYCAVQSLLVAVQLQEPDHQPSVESLDRILRNLDTLADIALVDLPTREVLRRHRAAQHEATLTAATTATSKADEATKLRDTLKSYQSSKHKMSLVDDGKSEMKNTKGDHLDIDPRTSKEVREKLEEEAFKASVPTKEMEIIEWEQALFRAAKRALARSKVQTPKVAKMIKMLLRSSKLNPDGEIALTRWEAEFYSHVAAQAHKKLNPAYSPINQDPTRPRRHSSSFNAGGLSDEDENGEEGDSDDSGEGTMESKNSVGNESQFTISSFGEESNPSWLGDNMSQAVSPSPGPHLVHGAVISPQSASSSPMHNDIGFGDLDVSSESEMDPNESPTRRQSLGQSQSNSQNFSQNPSQDTSRAPSRGQSRGQSRGHSALSRPSTGKSRVHSAQSAQSAQSGDTARSGYSAHSYVAAGSPYERINSAELDAESVVYSLEDDETSDNAAEAQSVPYHALSNDSHDTQSGLRQRFDSIALSDHPDHHEHHERAENEALATRQRFESIALSALASDDESVNVSPPTSEDEH